MKKLLFAALVFISLDAAAQGLRLNAYTNYVFDDNVNSTFDPNYFYDGKISGGFQWGAGLEYMIKEHYGIEASYFRQATTAPLRTALYPVNPHVYDMNINYILLSGTRYGRKPGGKVEGFGGLGMGVALINAIDPKPANPNRSNSTSLTKFAWQLRGGAIIWASEKVGVRLQAQLQSAVQAFGGGVFIGTGGANAGVTGFSTMFQFGLGGGLVFKFSGTTKTHQ